MGTERQRPQRLWQRVHRIDVVTASVIVATRNRRRLLADLLQGLELQDVSPGTFEIVVVDAGSTDGTAEMLAAWSGRHPLRHLALGPAALAKARNAGARASSGALLIFLDDDTVPAPGFVRAHVDAARVYPGEVVTGPCPITDARGPFRRMIAAWYARQYDTMAEAVGAGQNLAPDLLYGGNFVVPRNVFEKNGGFDESFVRYGGEDTDLGFRLHAAAVPLRYEPRAIVEHRFGTSWSVWVRRVRPQGASMIVIMLRHPAARYYPEEWLPARILRRKGAWLAWRAPLLGRAIVLPLLVAGQLLDAAGLDRPWQRVNRLVYDYHFWIGVRDVIGDLRDWERFLAEMRSA